ncbi:hypothetical protein KY389_07035 [Paracoccus bogoriensis]|uniref:hypothetical protein n=1 Tax=Paracoccus bogoriensis TaxID=242065 RepID=UPI001CA53864|nr:hypothetical protein [Paracoccus bogoriensis]MBW7056450.1 hypothetical protein [Paracoccus bogoriensis]
MTALRHLVNPSSVARLERALDHDPAALPIFERIERELEAARALMMARKAPSPVERARALLRANADTLAGRA